MRGLDWLVLLCSGLLGLSEKTRLLAALLIIIFVVFVFGGPGVLRRSGVRVREVKV